MGRRRVDGCMMFGSLQIVAVSVTIVVQKSACEENGAERGGGVGTGSSNTIHCEVIA